VETVEVVTDLLAVQVNQAQPTKVVEAVVLTLAVQVVLVVKV
tara:strand:+ start:532 stop:657 length:126 start_codon:yes stop_codon:yes gene_type:complete